MKHPFWIINSTLLMLLLCVYLFMLVSQVEIPEQQPINPSQFSAIKRDEAVKINIQKIYEDDLFNTYKKPIEPEKESIKVPPMPEPPKPQKLSIPKEAPINFLNPVNITLKGIIVMSNDHTKNSALISDNKTNLESSYKVGDMIEDAQVIRIFSNKVILLRTNGQQEILYLTEADAKNDPTYGMIDGWESITQKISPFEFIITPTIFLEHIKSLAQFIDLLGLTTAYKNGVAVGIKIGKVDTQSLGYHLGFETNDLITNIQDIHTAEITDRLAIYNRVIHAKPDDNITIDLIRKNQPIRLKYTISSDDITIIDDTQRPDKDNMVTTKQKEEISARELLEKKYTFAPTVQEIRAHEKRLIQESEKE